MEKVKVGRIICRLIGRWSRCCWPNRDASQAERSHSRTLNLKILFTHAIFSQLKYFSTRYSVKGMIYLKKEECPT